MAIFKTEAVVLKTHDFRETSKIVSVYSRKYGRLQLIAKGVRNRKSKFGTVLDTLNYLSIVYYFKDTRELQLLSNAELVKPFFNFRTDLKRFAYASIVAEIIYRTQLMGDENPRLFHALISVLDGIDGAADFRNYFNAFLIRFLEISGFRPGLRRCMNCRRIPEDNWVYFDFNRGGYLCEKCHNTGNANFRFSLIALKSLQVLIDSPWEEIEQINISENYLAEIEKFLLFYLKVHFDGLATLHAVDFLRSLNL